METYADKLHKDAVCFRDSINSKYFTCQTFAKAQTVVTSITAMTNSSTAFADAFLSIFTPGGSEFDLESKYPGASETIKQVGMYQTHMTELKEALVPEVELIDTRIIAPSVEFNEVIKKIKKSIAKRDHKVGRHGTLRCQCRRSPLWRTQLIDFDRHNNNYTKLREKQNKSLSDEKVCSRPSIHGVWLGIDVECMNAQNMFKVEQEFEQASQDYEFHNNSLKTELPRFFELATAFITPLFQSFYYMQRACGCLRTRRLHWS